jgi:hypothetical protein
VEELEHAPWSSIAGGRTDERTNDGKRANEKVNGSSDISSPPGAKFQRGETLELASNMCEFCRLQIVE